MNKQDPSIVLYVEDDEGELLHMQRAFKAQGLNSILETARSGKDAIDYLSRWDVLSPLEPASPLPSVVILDIDMPGLSGFDVLRWIRGRKAFSKLPVVMFSSSALEVDIQLSKALGATEYWVKPTSGESFLQVVGIIRTRWLEA